MGFSTEQSPCMQGRTQFLQKRECCAGALEGRFIATLARLNNAKTVLEVGMFTGTTTLAVAQALPEDGKVGALPNPACAGSTAMLACALPRCCQTSTCWPQV